MKIAFFKFAGMENGCLDYNTRITTNKCQFLLRTSIRVPIIIN